MANLWWAYDENNGNFSALPASPVLLPAIGLFFLLAVFDKMNSGPKVIGKTDAISKHGELFEANKTRFYELIAIMRRRPLTDDERTELYKIQHPPWADPGEVWTY